MDDTGALFGLDFACTRGSQSARHRGGSRNLLLFWLEIHWIDFELLKTIENWGRITGNVGKKGRPEDRFALRASCNCHFRERNPSSGSGMDTEQFYISHIE